MWQIATAIAILTVVLVAVLWRLGTDQLRPGQAFVIACAASMTGFVVLAGVAGALQNGRRPFIVSVPTWIFIASFVTGIVLVKRQRVLLEHQRKFSDSEESSP